MKLLSIKSLSLMLTLAFSYQAFASGDHSHHHAVPTTNAITNNSLNVFKSATCGCCKKWVSHLKEQGLTVTSENNDDMSALKDKFSIGKKYRSCHTGISKDGYIFEGHVPAKFIQRFLKERPADAIGLSVPGMPVGSPGMVVGNKFMPYQILKLNKDGSSEVYAKINFTHEQF